MKNENENENENEECKKKDDVLLEKEPKAPPLLKKVEGENKNLSGYILQIKIFFDF
ncbi:hypothetical protein G8C41_03645 [Apibacter sp. B3706]|uniref:hypothetical protein n=1 Tax=Apibacter sp. B3706 TaxID=2656760 RepID=UPI001408CF37|nr:hypothetical protein [Apibacter sp. B3706]QII69944.1 hypothetical protein G8C41_03645 [Apibacter sp. B3706]